MRSQQLDLKIYDTDKINSGYLKWYDPIFEKLVFDEVKLLEIGIYNGGSLCLWRDYFPKGEITGIDLQIPTSMDNLDRINMFQGSQTDVDFLTHVSEQVAPDGFDIIIDDASHIARFTQISFWHLFDNYLKPSGLFILEDWGCGYWDDWPDGKKYHTPQVPDEEMKSPWQNHNYGMVGLIKELIDEQGAVALTRGQINGKATRVSKFESMLITSPMVVIKKRSW